ncbi:MAG: tyrosine-type recombinase/integrase [Planctomycetaceae bacterium]
MNNHALIPGNRQLSATSGVAVPSVIRDAGPDAIRRFVEFFTANIRNPNTRAAYSRAVNRFCRWTEQHKLALDRVEPVLVAAYVEELQKQYSDLSVKQHLAAIRMLFDYLVTGGILRVNPAASVKGPKVVIAKGKTPILSAREARLLLDSIDATMLSGLRDRALIALMVHTFARVGAALKMKVSDVRLSDRRYWVRLHEKGGRHHEMPLQHNAERYLLEYLDAAGLHDQPASPLFRTIGRRRYLTPNAMHRNDALRMIKRHAIAAGISPHICSHTFRATGITEYMRNGGTLEKAQQMAAHASSQTTQMYNRVADSVTLDEVERVLI